MARSDAYNKVVEDLNAGLNATRRNGEWRLSALIPIVREPPAIIPRSGNVTVSANMQLLNDQGRIIANSNNVLSGTFSFAERETVLQNRADINRFIFTLNADDITDQMTIRINANTSPAQNHLVQVMTFREFINTRGMEFINTIGIVPYGVTTISDRQFNRQNLTTAIIPDSVTSIGEWAFYGNQLTNLIISNRITRIRAYTFYMNRLTSVTIPNSVTRIDDFAFLGPITSITIGANVRLARFSFGPYENDFVQFYNNNRRRAGTYTLIGAR